MRQAPLKAVAILMFLASSTAVAQVRYSEELQPLLYPEGVGELLNQPNLKNLPAVREAEVVLYQILQNLLQDHPKKNLFDWRIGIYKSDQNTAWAGLFSAQALNSPEGKPYKLFFRSQGNRPVAYIGITTAMIKALGTYDQLAFVLGHEATHHLAGHTATESPLDISEKLNHQQNEVAADRGSLDLMKGHYALTAASNSLKKFVLLPDVTNKNYSVIEQRNLTVEALLTSHHSPGLRLNIMQSSQQQLQRENIGLFTQTETALPSSFRNLPSQSKASGSGSRGWDPKFKSLSDIQTKMNSMAPTLDQSSNEELSSLYDAIERTKGSDSSLSSADISALQEIQKTLRIEMSRRLGSFDFSEMPRLELEPRSQQYHSIVDEWLDFLRILKPTLTTADAKTFTLILLSSEKDLATKNLPPPMGIPLGIAFYLTADSVPGQLFLKALTSDEIDSKTKIRLVQVLLHQASAATLHFFESLPVAKSSLRNVFDSLSLNENLKFLLRGNLAEDLTNRLELLSRLGALEKIKASADSGPGLESFLVKYEQLNPKRKISKYGNNILIWALEHLQKNPSVDPAPLLEKVLDLLSPQFIVSPRESALASAVLQKNLDKFAGDRLINELKKTWRRQVMTAASLSINLQRGVQTKLGPKPTRAEINLLWAELSKDFNFEGNGKQLGLSLRDHLAGVYHTQPSDTSTQMQLPREMDLNKVSHGALAVRGTSAVLTMIQTESFENQLAAIDYLAGRSSKVPGFVQEIDDSDKGQFKLVAIFEELRAHLYKQPLAARTLFFNSFFQGSNNQLLVAAKENALYDHIFAGIQSPEKRRVANDLAKAIKSAEGPYFTFILSALLAEIPEGEKSYISETHLLKVVLESYGVPGWKLAQYLAFTGSFKEYESELSKYQDAAPAPGYFEILELIDSQLGKKINGKDILVLRLIGAGSVNLAVEYVDLKSTETRVINVSRKNIKNKTEVDFLRFERLMKSLADLSKSGKDYSFLVGLSNVIKESVKLEFDRTAVLARQKDAIQIYQSNELKGWKIQTVPEYGLHGDVMLMGLAKGISAKKLLQQNPRLYQSAMKAVYTLEYDLLFGKIRNQAGIRLANPDLHDGQFLIDEKTKVISVIDFGQAVPISEAERSLGFDLLSMASGLQSTTKMAQGLQAWAQRFGAKAKFDASDFQAVPKIKDPMDRFVRIISLTNTHDFEIPLSSIHMVLAVNRLVKLGEKIGRTPKLSVGLKLMGRELAKPLGLAGVRSFPTSIFRCEQVFNEP